MGAPALDQSQRLLPHPPLMNMFSTAFNLFDYFNMVKVVKFKVENRKLISHVDLDHERAFLMSFELCMSAIVIGLINWLDVHVLLTR